MIYDDHHEWISVHCRIAIILWGIHFVGSEGVEFSKLIFNSLFDNIVERITFRFKN